MAVGDKELVEAVLAEHPLSQAMPELAFPKPGGSPELACRVQASEASPEIKAALLLLLDELDLSHGISQGISSATGSFLHAMMHRREGDFSNAHYWLRRAGRHPFLGRLPGFDPGRLVDQAERSHRSNPAELVDLQRQEWNALVQWILDQGQAP